MRKFDDYIKFREGGSATEVGNNVVGSASLSPQEEGQLSALFEAIKVAWNRYRVRTADFLHQLNDQDIEAALKKIEDEGVNDLSRATRKTGDSNDDDAVVVPKSDGNPGLDDDGGGSWD